MNLISAFNALWDIASTEERKQWDECGDGADVISQIEAENKALRDALGDAIDYVSGNLDISIRGDDLKETWQALKGGGE